MARLKFDEQLKQLNAEMILMGSMIQEAIQKATEALLTQNVEVSRKIIDDDEVIDHKEKEIEAICYSLLIQQQPVARDLRKITAALKMVTDMERIGDHAADISEMTIMMAEHQYCMQTDNLKKMAAETIIMLNHAIESYVEKDVVKARAVIEHDDVVDGLFLTVRNELLDAIRERAEVGEQAADLMLVDKYLERIGDHATNLAEWVIFAIEDNRETH